MYKQMPMRKRTSSGIAIYLESLNVEKAFSNLYNRSKKHDGGQELIPLRVCPGQKELL